MMKFVSVGVGEGCAAAPSVEGARSTCGVRTIR